MDQRLISLKLTVSKFILATIATFTIAVCILSSQANVSLWYRLLIVSSVIIWAAYNVFTYFHERITQCDLLTDINSTIQLATANHQPYGNSATKSYCPLML